MRKYNWTGLLIEPITLAYEKILYKRRHVYSINACIAEKKPFIAKFKDLGALSGQQNDFTEDHLKNMKNWLRNDKLNTAEEFYVPCFSLNTILRAIDVNRVDFFSLDTEGNEWKVLRSVDLKTIDMRSIMIEWFPDSEKNKVMKKYLEEHGYQLLFDNNYEIFYVKKTI